MKTKRSLGQNFFINKNLGDYISSILSTIDCESIIEIGPGMGFFTQRLQDLFKNVMVIEKDTQLSESLKIQFPNIKVVNSDFLDVNLENIIKGEVSFFGSLPFNIAKAIIRKVIESQYFTKPSLFIVQKEVADKYIYKPPYSTLSLTTSIYANCKKIIDISPDSFRPKPNVNSSLISFTPNNRNVIDTLLLEDVIKKAFKQPRKNIYNNLKGTKFEKGISAFKTLRPAQLSLDEYIQICKNSL